MNFDDLLREFHSEVIGEGILSLVENVVDVILSSSARFRYIDRDDALQGFVCDSLLGGGQLTYAFDVSRETGHLRALLIKQFRRYLATNRKKTVVDNLLERCQVRSQNPPFTRFDRPSEWAFSITGKDLRPDSMVSRKVQEIAAEISPSYHFTDAGDRERAPVLLSDSDLGRLMLKMAEAMECEVGRSDLRRLFQLAFTSFIPSFLSSDEAGNAALKSRSPGYSPEDDVTVEKLTAEVLAALDGEDRKILRFKLEDVSDEVVSRTLGVSRPTLAKRKHAVFQKIRERVENLPESIQNSVVEALEEELRRVDVN